MKTVVVLVVRSAVHLEAFLIKQGILFFLIKQGVSNILGVCRGVCMKSHASYAEAWYIILHWKWFCWTFCKILQFIYYFDNFLKWYIFVLQDKLKFLVLHHFMKCFLKIMFTKLLLDEERNGWWWISLIRMFLKLSQCGIIWYLLAGFKTIILWSVHFIQLVKYVLLKYGSWKLQLEFWNMNHELLKVTFATKLFFVIKQCLMCN